MEENFKIFVLVFVLMEVKIAEKGTFGRNFKVSANMHEVESCMGS